MRKQFNNNKNELNNNIVINLSNKQLTHPQLSLLNKGLGFVPNIEIPKVKEINTDISRFERNLQIHYFFASKDIEDSSKPSDFITLQILTGNSGWWPKKLNPHITDFCFEIKKLINDTLHGRRNNNLSDKCTTALHQLRRDKSIIIKRCDKGGGIAVMDFIEYRNKIFDMLNDIKVYTKIDKDDSADVKIEADLLINKLHDSRFISDKQLKYLTNFTAKCPIFYGLPKTHKNNWPLRPIVSQINGPTNRISELLDKYLTIAEKSIPNILQDTTAYLNLINKYKICEDNTLLVTMDVTSLYTNIPYEEGAIFVSNYYEETLHLWKKDSENLPPIPKEDIHFLILFLLKHCTFKFDSQLFRQNYGTTMGSKFSVKFANIYMHMWFKHYLKNYDGCKPKFIGRLVDDCFYSWSESEENLFKLFNYLNSCHETIKFETTYSYISVNFLDTTTYIEDNLIKTTLYKKPTDRKQYLHFNSMHPNHTKKAIPFSQAIRYKRIIEDNVKLTLELDNLRQSFINRKYPPSLVESQINKVHNINRSSLLQYKSIKNKNDKFQDFLKDRSFLPLIIRYNYGMTEKNFNSAFKLKWNKFIGSTDTIKRIFNKELPQLIFKRGKTLNNYLVSSVFNSLNDNTDYENIRILTELSADVPISPCISNSYPTGGVSRCGIPLCLCCNYILTSNTYQDTDKLNTYTITDSLNCNSSNIIYLITCNKCDKKYVGQTSLTLKNRLNNHRSNINLNKPTAIGIHFNEPRHSHKNLKILPIIDITQHNKFNRDKIEKSYMTKLNTIYPHGLNYYPLIKLTN